MREHYRNGDEIHMTGRCCDGCDPWYVNGVLCHEKGCPESWRDYTGECFECGCEFFPATPRDMVCPDCASDLNAQYDEDPGTDEYDETEDETDKEQPLQPSMMWGWAHTTSKMFPKIPRHMVNCLGYYMFLHEDPGGFLTAALSGDLMQACARADLENGGLLVEYAKVMVNRMPEASYGSHENVNNWLISAAKQGDDNGS